MNVPEEIARVARYGQQLQDLLDGKELELSGDRDALLIAYWNLLLDYHVAIVTLLAQELHGAAFALMLPIIEAWVRIHVTKMGSDEEVLAIKEDKYRVDFKTRCAVGVPCQSIRYAPNRAFSVLLKSASVRAYFRGK